jgi:hypothetical protein
MTAVSFSVHFVKTDGVDSLHLRLMIQSNSMEARLMFVEDHTVPFKTARPRRVLANERSPICTYCPHHGWVLLV